MRMFHAIVSRWRVANGDINSGVGIDGKETFLSREFSHAFSGHREAVGLGNEAVENGVGERRAANDFVPLLYGDLAADEGRAR